MYDYIHSVYRDRAQQTSIPLLWALHIYLLIDQPWLDTERRCDRLYTEKWRGALQCSVYP